MVSRMAYDPYGLATTVSGAVLPTIQYAGYYQNQTSGLNLTWFRAYDANTGRWLSRDPLGTRGGLNLYEYCGDEPSDYADSVGLNPWYVVPGTLFSGPGDMNPSAYTGQWINPNALGASLPATLPPNTCIRICSSDN
jgi:RHS repeat-associated protein